MALTNLASSDFTMLSSSQSTEVDGQGVERGAKPILRQGGQITALSQGSELFWLQEIEIHFN